MMMMISQLKGAKPKRSDPRYPEWVRSKRVWLVEANSLFIGKYRSESNAAVSPLYLFTYSWIKVLVSDLFCPVLESTAQNVFLLPPASSSYLMSTTNPPPPQAQGARMTTEKKEKLDGAQLLVLQTAPLTFP